jgi:hypothetical protein
MVYVGRWNRVVLLGLILSAAAACGGKGVSVSEVEGTVLWNKKPLKNVEVQFLPDSELGTTGPRSTAITDDQGHYNLSFDDDKPGAVVGHHRVLLLEMDEDADREGKGAGRRGDRNARSRQQPTNKPVLPERYKKAATTPLKREVRTGKQTIDFDLP